MSLDSYFLPTMIYTHTGWLKYYWLFKIQLKKSSGAHFYTYCIHQNPRLISPLIRFMCLKKIGLEKMVSSFLLNLNLPHNVQVSKQRVHMWVFHLGYSAWGGKKQLARMLHANLRKSLLVRPLGFSNADGIISAGLKQTDFTQKIFRTSFPRRCVIYGKTSPGVEITRVCGQQKSYRTKFGF